MFQGRVTVRRPSDQIGWCFAVIHSHWAEAHKVYYNNHKLVVRFHVILTDYRRYKMALKEPKELPQTYIRNSYV